MRVKKAIIRFSIIGAGWRARMYLRIARALPESFEVVGVLVRDPAKRPALQKEFGVRTFAGLDGLFKCGEAAFTVTSVSWQSNPGIIAACAKKGLAVLSETPPAPDIKGLNALARLARKGARIQVAEQYWLVAHHAARLAAVKKGLIGKVSEAQVSAAHGYHGISLVRRFLGVGPECPKITAMRFNSRMMKWPDLDGRVKQGHAMATQDITWLDFGDRFGVLDFTEPQYYSPIRGERVLIRGDRGEIVNDDVYWMKDSRTPLHAAMERCLGGLEDKVGGLCFQGIRMDNDWLYRSPFPEVGLSVHELAMAECLLKMDDYVRTGKDFYSLAEAAQDHYLSILCQQAIARRKPVIAQPQSWAGKLTPPPGKRAYPEQ